MYHTTLAGQRGLSCYHTETESMAELGEQVDETIHEHEHGHSSGLGSIVALLVALAATFVALISVKDRNITLRMDQAQAKAIDTWNYYQAKSMKQNLAEATLDQLRRARLGAGRGRESVDKRIANYEKQVKRYDHEKGEVKEEAEGYEKTLRSAQRAARPLRLVRGGDVGRDRAPRRHGADAEALAARRRGRVPADWGLLRGRWLLNWPIHPESAIKWLA